MPPTSEHGSEILGYHLGVDEFWQPVVLFGGCVGRTDTGEPWGELCRYARGRSTLARLITVREGPIAAGPQDRECHFLIDDAVVGGQAPLQDPPRPRSAAHLIGVVPLSAANSALSPRQPATRHAARAGSAVESSPPAKGLKTSAELAEIAKPGGYP